jgi:hypothetical protein
VVDWVEHHCNHRVVEEEGGSTRIVLLAVVVVDYSRRIVVEVVHSSAEDVWNVVSICFQTAKPVDSY